MTQGRKASKDQIPVKYKGNEVNIVRFTWKNMMTIL